MIVKILVFIIRLFFILALALGLLMTFTGAASVGIPFLILGAIGLAAINQANKSAQKRRTHVTSGAEVQLDTAERSPDDGNYVAVVCDACGGVTKLPAGARGKCDYCDGPIHG